MKTLQIWNALVLQKIHGSSNWNFTNISKINRTTDQDLQNCSKINPWILCLEYSNNGCSYFIYFEPDQLSMPWHSFNYFVVGSQLCWKDHLDFHCHNVCMDVCMYGRCRFLVNISTKKVNLSMNTLTDFCKTWYVGSGGQMYYQRGLSSPNAHT